MTKYLTVRQIANGTGCSLTLVHNLLCRSEFTSYRFDSRPMRIKWTPTVENMLISLIEKRFKNAKNNGKRARSFEAIHIQ